jgi:hypothetical protein
MNFFEFLKNQINLISKEEELLYEYVAHEIEQNTLSRGLWMKALSESDFDEGVHARFTLKQESPHFDKSCKNFALS